MDSRFRGNDGPQQAYRFSHTVNADIDAPYNPSNSLRSFEGLIDCSLHFARRNRTLDQLAANPETRRRSYAAALRALLIAGNQCGDRWRAETRMVPGLINADRLGQRIKRRRRIWKHFPTRLPCEQCVVHLPELVLRA